MWNRKELKQQAKVSLKRNYWKAVLATALMLGLYAGSGSAGTVGKTVQQATDQMSTGVAVVFSLLMVICSVAALLLFAFVISPLEVGASQFRLNALKGEGKVSDLGHGYDVSYKRNVVTLLCRNIFLALWTLLFVVPGIIKIYEYRMIPYILAENPDMSRKEVFQKSKEMMKGNKWKAFVLDLSFILWNILGGITGGIVTVLYVDPYMQLTEAALYESLKK